MANATASRYKSKRSSFCCKLRTAVSSNPPRFTVRRLDMVNYVLYENTLLSQLVHPLRRHRATKTAYSLMLWPQQTEQNCL